MDRWRRESCSWIILILAALFMMRHTVWIVYSQCDFLKAVVFFRSRWLFIRYNVWSWRITIVKVAQSITGRWALVSVSLDMFSWTPHGVLCQPSTQSGLAWNRWLFLVLSLLSTSALFQQHQCGECLNQQQCVYTYSLETEPMTGGLWVDWPTHLLPPNGATHRLWCVASGLLKLHMPQSTVTCNRSRYCKFFREPTRQRMGHLKYDELLNHSSASTSVFLWRVLCSCLTARCVKIQFICKAHLVNLRIWPMRCASGKCTFDQSPNKIWFM